MSIEKIVQRLKENSKPDTTWIVKAKKRKMETIIEFLKNEIIFGEWSESLLRITEDVIGNTRVFRQVYLFENNKKFMWVIIVRNKAYTTKKINSIKDLLNINFDKIEINIQEKRNPTVFIQSFSHENN